MRVKDIYKCQCCDNIFEGQEYTDNNGLRYNTQKLYEHKCKEGKYGFALKVGYRIIKEN